jgi:hypothetical protein
MPRHDRALAAMGHAWHAAQRQALEDALQAVRGDDWADCLGRWGGQLLLVLRHAAALDELPAGTVEGWIHAQDLRPALGILSRSGRLGARVDALRLIPQPAHAAVWATASRLLGTTR